MIDDITVQNFVSNLRKMTKRDTPNNMIIGTIESISPLQINIGNDVILDDKMLFLGQMCRPYKVTIPHTHLIDAYLTEKSKSLLTKSVTNTGVNTAGVITNNSNITNDTNNVDYTIKTQDITPDDDKGTNKRELKTEDKKQVDLGGAKITKFSVDVAGSNVTDKGAGDKYTPATIPNGDTVTQTADSSAIEIDGKEHQHLVTEKVTQDVHFPDTDYEDSVEIQIYPRLKKGDKVLMFAFNNYQMYYVAERIEEAE